MIITFYSFKGGVGRSMAMANVGEILADWGYHVVLCDWDLEAPGLERYMTSLESFLTSSSTEEDKKRAYEKAQRKADEYKAKPGLMDLLKEYKDMMTRTPGEVERRLKRSPDITSNKLDSAFEKKGDLYLRRPSTYAFPVSTEMPRDGSMRLLTAGRRDGEFYQRYAEDVRNFDWEDFYEQWAGASYIEFFRNDLLVAKTDLVLVDSRTGVTEHGGVATHHLADMVILFSAANQMNIEGTEWMAGELNDPSLKELRGGRNLQIFPVPSRIEQTAQVEELAAFRREFAQEFSNYALKLNGTRAEDFYDAVEIPYMPYYSYKERVVAREEEGKRERKLYKSYQAVAQCIVNHGVSTKLLRERPSESHDFISLLTATSRPVKLLEGTVLFSYAQEDQPIAEALAEGLKEAKIRTEFTPASRPRTRDTNSSHQLGEVDVSNAAGQIMLVGSKGFDQRMQAEFDTALRQCALRPGFRLMLLLIAEGSPKVLPPYAARLRPIELPRDFSPTDAELFRSLAAQISGDAPVFSLEEQTSPYPGFAPFEEEQERFFFGRDAEVRELTKLMGEIPAEHARWLQIEGSNGSGKTSLAHAGFIPAVRCGLIKEAPLDWKIVKLNLTKNVFESLALALYDSSSHRSHSELQTTLSGKNGLKKVIRELTPPRHAFLLVVNNFKILLDGEIEKDVLESFDEQFVGILEDTDLSFYLVTTLRSDYVTSLNLLPKLENIFQKEAKRYQVEKISETGLIDMITGPAQLAGVTLEMGLLERIISEVIETEQPLALLGTLLQSLWEKRTGSLLTHSAYQELGGLRALLIKHADSVIDGLGPMQVEPARKLVLELVRIGLGLKNGARNDDTRLAIPLSEAQAVAGGDAVEARKLLNYLFAPPRLLVINGSDQVELLHESLVRHWSRLRQWVDERRDALRRRDSIMARAGKDAIPLLRWLETLQLDIDSWEKSLQDKRLLLSGARLSFAERMLRAHTDDLNAAEKSFIRHSRWHQLRRRLKVAAIITIAIVSIALLFIYWERQKRADNNQKAGDSIQMGQNYRKSNDVDRAIAEFNDAIQLNPDSADAYYYRGLAYASKGEHDLAVKDFEKAIELDPNLTGVNVSYGISLAKSGDYKAAITKLEGLPDNNRDFTEAIYYRGYANDKLGRMEEALNDYTKAIALNPDYAEAYNRRATIYRDMGDFERAIAGYNRAIELNRKFVEAYNNRGYAYANAKDPDSKLAGEDYTELAIEDYTTAIQFDVKFAPAYYNRGVAYMSKNDYDRALLDFDLALQLTPRAAAVYNKRCAIYARFKDKIDLALENCNKAIEYGDDKSSEAYHDNGQIDAAIGKHENALAYSNRGQVYAARGEHGDAIKDYTKALELDPDLNEVYYYRGISYRAQNDKNKALSDLRRFVSASSDTELVQMARQALGALGYQTPPSETTISLRTITANDPITETVKTDLSNQGYIVQVVRLDEYTEVGAGLDASIKYFHAADEKNARAIEGVIEQTVADQGYSLTFSNVSGLLRYGRARKVPFGIIEVSIPRLERQFLKD